MNRREDGEMARLSNYTASRLAILDLIAEAQARHSRPPTVRRLATELHIGVATMHSYLRQLAEEGLVEWTPNMHRSLRLTPQGSLRVSSQETPSA